MRCNRVPITGGYAHRAWRLGARVALFSRRGAPAGAQQRAGRGGCGQQQRENNFAPSQATQKKEEEEGSSHRPLAETLAEDLVRGIEKQMS